MKLNGISSKVIQYADTLGVLAGVGLGTSYGINAITEVAEKIMQGNIHFPDVGGMLQEYVQSDFFKQGVIGAVLGYAMKEVNVMGTGKWGNALTKASVGYIKGGLLMRTLWYSTHSPGYPGDVKGATKFVSQAPIYEY